MESQNISAIQKLDKLNALPEQVRSFILSPEALENTAKLRKNHSLDIGTFLAIKKTIYQLYDKEIALTNFEQTMKAAVKLPEEKIKAILLEIAGYELLPLSDFFGDVDAFIRSLGGDPAKYPATRITIRAITPSELVTEFLHDHPVAVPAFLEHRLREILESRVRGVRKDDEAIARLTRAEKIGGVELAQAEAETLVAELDSKIASVKIKSDNEPIAPKPQNNQQLTTRTQRDSKSQQPEFKEIPNPNNQNSRTIEIVAKVDNTPRLASSAGKSIISKGNISKKGDSVTPEDEREANLVREQVLPNVVPASFFDLDKEIKAATETVFTVYGATLPKDIQERFRTIVTSRLKGVRVAADTRELLSREPGKGGMGFGLGLADDISAAIENEANTINKKREDAMNKEKEAFTKTTVLNTAAKDESRKQTEQDEINRLYGSLTIKKGKGPTVEARPPRENSHPPPSNRAATLSAAPPAKMRDVRAVETTTPSAARLTGPTEELRNMTLADFRRLSADPNEACRKLIDKLDLLQEQGYAQRIEGIKAWQSSEMQKLYLDIINASFGGGKPIAAAIADAEAASKQTLTEREVHAIMEFNRGLKA